jgi:hypothetical protein
MFIRDKHSSLFRMIIDLQVGENIILHVRSNFFLRDFHCVVIASGLIQFKQLLSNFIQPF